MSVFCPTYILFQRKKTVDSSYYIEHIHKKLKPALNPTRTTGKINTRNLVPYPGLAVFMQDGATPHTAVATQTWSDDNLPNFIEKRMAWQFTRFKLYRESLKYSWTVLKKTPAPQHSPSCIVICAPLEDNITKAHIKHVNFSFFICYLHVPIDS